MSNMQGYIPVTRRNCRERVLKDRKNVVSCLHKIVNRIDQIV